MWKTILDLFFPINCLGCGQEGQFICLSCFEKIPLNRKPPFKRLIIASHYKYPLIKQAIHRYKYDFIKDLAEPLAKLMVKVIRERFFENALLIPVPLHKKRLRWRGFNQAELLALEISQNLNIPMANDILIRTKHNLPQAKITDAQARRTNIKNAFKLNKRPCIKNKTILLIDDVCTTGATLEECAKVLKPLKPKQIWGLVVARG